MNANTILWILQIILGVMFLMVGGMKLMQPKEAIAERMAWANDFSANTIKTIGGLEVAGALGLILPWLTGILIILTPLAAIGLLLTMIGAAVVHIRRGEYSSVVMNVVLGLLAAYVAYGRF